MPCLRSWSCQGKPCSGRGHAPRAHREQNTQGSPAARRALCQAPSPALGDGAWQGCNKTGLFPESQSSAGPGSMTQSEPALDFGWTEEEGCLNDQGSPCPCDWPSFRALPFRLGREMLSLCPAQLFNGDIFIMQRNGSLPPHHGVTEWF